MYFKEFQLTLNNNKKIFILRAFSIFFFLLQAKAKSNLCKVKTKSMLLFHWWNVQGPKAVCHNIAMYFIYFP